MCDSMEMVVVGESKVDDRGRVILPKPLRDYEKVLFYELVIDGQKYIVVKGEE